MKPSGTKAVSSSIWHPGNIRNALRNTSQRETNSSQSHFVKKRGISFDKGNLRQDGQRRHGKVPGGGEHRGACGHTEVPQAWVYIPERFVHRDGVCV